ncbi:MAG: hypothetical protein GOP50_07940 [Candidatus Heimdallarchaeota archaeon]|nr:hypothetical protein [Candidatus Heimdallarchaeota archaeon]
MKKQIFMTIVILSVLAFVPITSTADYPTGTLGYSDEIAVDSEFEWTVSKLQFTGDFATYTDYVYINTTNLTQGDKIKVVVTDDPDTAIGEWYEVYLNDVEIATPTLGNFIYYSMYDIGYSSFFINPVTYTNATGTYNIYEQMLEEVEGYNDDYTYSTSGVDTDVTYDITYQFQVEYKITGDVFSVYIYTNFNIQVEGGGYDYTVKQEMRIESTLNIRTGLYGKMELYANFDYAGNVGILHMLIDSGYAKTPYEWAFSFLGLTVIASVVGLIKRKR